MSAFGYEPSYMQRGSTVSVGAPVNNGVQGGLQSPGYAGNSYTPIPEQRINFAPEANPNFKPDEIGGWRYTGPNGTQFWEGAGAKKRRQEAGERNAYQAGKWYAVPGNPLDNIFGGDNSLSGSAKMNGQLGNTPGQAAYSYMDSKGGPVEAAPVFGGGYTPKTFNELNAQIQGLSTDQLIMLDSANKYQSQFQSAAQAYANAFSNADYAKYSNAQGGFSAGKNGAGLDKSGPNAFNQGNVQNWLQDSYNSILTRLNDNWLL